MPSKPEKIVTERGGVPLTPYQLFKEIQDTIKVGKTHFNSFSKFYFRSVEDVYNSWKTLEIPLVLRLSDEVIDRGGRLFIEATAQVKDLKGVVVEESKAQAELGTGKAGMSSEQATGSASSYARKYALNGLFLLDDSKDPDDDGTGAPKSPVPAPDAAKLAEVKQKEKVKALQDAIRGDAAKTAKATTLLAGRSLIKLSVEELDKIIDAVKSK